MMKCGDSLLVYFLFLIANTITAKRIVWGNTDTFAISFLSARKQELS